MSLKRKTETQDTAVLTINGLDYETSGNTPAFKIMQLAQDYERRLSISNRYIEAAEFLLFNHDRFFVKRDDLTEKEEQAYEHWCETFAIDIRGG